MIAVARQSQQSTVRLATIGFSILCGCWAISQTAPSSAQEILFPPTTTIPGISESESYPAVPQALPNNATPPRTVPNFSPSPNLAASLYRVEIAGGDPLLLSQVQSIVPEAFLRYGDGAIQAGSFAEVSNAQRRVQLLASQGIAARMVTVGGNSTDNRAYPTPATNPYPVSYPTQQIPNFSTSYPQTSYPTQTNNPNFIGATQRREEDSRGFFVVIPGSPEELNKIATQLIQLGTRPSAIQERSQPRGWHIAVGPFENREEADTWNALFRSEGLDARLFFQ